MNYQAIEETIEVNFSLMKTESCQVNKRNYETSENFIPHSHHHIHCSPCENGCAYVMYNKIIRSYDSFKGNLKKKMLECTL